MHVFVYLYIWICVFVFVFVYLYLCLCICICVCVFLFVYSSFAEHTWIHCGGTQGWARVPFISSELTTDSLLLLTLRRQPVFVSSNICIFMYLWIFIENQLFLLLSAFQHHVVLKVEHNQITNKNILAPNWPKSKTKSEVCTVAPEIFKKSLGKIYFMHVWDLKKKLGKLQKRQLACVESSLAYFWLALLIPLRLISLLTNRSDCLVYFWWTLLFSANSPLKRHPDPPDGCPLISICCSKHSKTHNCSKHRVINGIGGCFNCSMFQLTWHLSSGIWTVFNLQSNWNLAGWSSKGVLLDFVFKKIKIDLNKL